MAGPSWLAAVFGGVMIVTAAYCACRLTAARLWRRPTEVDADAVHVVMAVAMAGMFLPRLSPLPGGAWEAVFGMTAAWFGWHAVRTLRGNTAGRWRCSHPVPHLVESVAMIYMIAAVPRSPAATSGQGMPMPGMAGGTAGSFPALAVVLALFLVGSTLWTADQLRFQARVTAGATAAAGPASAEPRYPAGSPALAPRLAACSRIAMGITMGYMLLAML